MIQCTSCNCLYDGAQRGSCPVCGSQSAIASIGLTPPDPELERLRAENEALRWNLTALNTALWQACGGDSKKIALYIENAGGDKDDIDAALQEPKP